MSPEPVTDDRPDHLPAYLSNGVVGIRVRRVPLHSGLAVLSGLEGEHPDAAIACVPTVPYPLAGDIKVGPAWLSQNPEHVHGVSQRYDFETGELHSTFLFSYDGLEAAVDVLTFCCRSQPSLVAQEITVRASHACEVILQAGVDPTGVAGAWRERSLTVPDAESDDVDGVMRWETLGAMATVGIAYWSEQVGGADAARSKAGATESPLMTAYRTKVRKDQRFTVRQVTALVPSASHQQPHRHAIRLVALGRRAGFDRLRRENADAWRELWRGRIVLIGADPAWQARADAAFFYLHTSTHPGSLSTHPFGLAQWFGYHYYYGHVMWDVETFLFPSLVLTNPGAALAMLDYRTRCLPAARENARLSARNGLQFPWQSSASHGEEAAPGLGTAANYEHHVTPDVAKAFAEYTHATGNDVFRRTRAWPVLLGVADWIVSRGTRTQRGWEIPEAMGIAERKEPADNAAFVNMAATVALHEAIACAERLDFEVPAAWRSMADGLVLPVNDRNVILDHDGYTRREEKAATPAALAGLFPLGYRVSDAVEDATLRFYLDMADDYVGSPMLSSLLGVWAAMLGDRTRSAHMFEEGYAAFTTDRFNVMHEYRHDKFPEQPVSGPFLANAGGFLLGCLYGLTGIRLGPGEPSSWCERSVVMPELWDGVEVERIWVRDRPASLQAKHGDTSARIDVW